eukprot:scaffold767_cov385-Pavlova_lutheri.AAC.3
MNSTAIKKRPTLEVERTYRTETSDPRFSGTQRTKAPCGEILLASFLMVLGLVLCSMSYLHYSEHVKGQSAADAGFAILGMLTFVPGFHYTRIAYYAWRERKGYDFQDMH